MLIWSICLLGLVFCQDWLVSVCFLCRNISYYPNIDCLDICVRTGLSVCFQYNKVWFVSGLVCQDWSVQFHNKNLHTFTPLDNLKIGSASVKPSSTVRDLEFYLDSALCLVMCLKFVIPLLLPILFLELVVLGIFQIAHTPNVLYTPLSLLISTTNSMLHNLPKNLTQRLQFLQHSAARLVTRTRKHEHISPVLFDLHACL